MVEPRLSLFEHCRQWYCGFYYALASVGADPPADLFDVVFFLTYTEDPLRSGAYMRSAMVRKDHWRTRDRQAIEAYWGVKFMRWANVSTK